MASTGRTGIQTHRLLTHTNTHTHTHTHHLLTHAHTSASAVFESKPLAALQTARDHKQAGTK